MGWVLVALLLAVIVFLLGPRPDGTYALRSIELPDDLDDYLHRSEQRFEDLVPGTEKTIIWAGDAGQRQPLSVVYLHGFSASRQEVAPLPERVAAELGANLFYTRLTGHGRARAPMAGVSMQALVDDAREALAIGERLGERVVVIGSSTGATLALWLATQAPSASVAATVVISPNLGLKVAGSSLLTAPWATYLVPRLKGDIYSWEPKNEAQGRYWLTRYPTRALLPMAMLTRTVANTKSIKLHAALLALYSDRDRVVDAAATERFLARADGQDVTVIKVEGAADPANHIIAGDIVSPNMTVPMATSIVEFVRRAGASC